MQNLRRSVPSFRCKLLGIQVIVSVVVIGMMKYWNNALMIPDHCHHLSRSLDKLAPSNDDYKNIINVEETKNNYSKFLEFQKNRNSSWGIEQKPKQICGEDQNAHSSQNQNRTPSSKLLIDEKPQRPSNSFIILTTVNAEFVVIAENWLESIRRLGLRYNITLVAEDEDTYKYFSTRANSELHVLYQKHYTFNFTWDYGPQRGHLDLIRRRTVYIRALLEQGIDVLLVDIDTVWIRNPVDLVLSEYSGYDLWLAQGFERKLHVVLQMPCPCFMYMKATPGVRTLVQEWISRLENGTIGKGEKHETDQVALSKVLPLFPDVPTKMMSYAHLPSGQQYFDRSWLALHRDDVYVAHGNHYGRGSGKKEKFKEFGLWLLNS